ncbi:hypothetical protein O0J73_07230 [Stenotrophomonas sp. Sm6012]|uniref:hypothetical protein n=1 Tax=Stenotrophomonas sp. Sm6012 TaxID=3002745 RepID=UPI0027E42B15|nr:hypothetical protein [Stenotrophomonas sp. Sm6012]MDQ7280524.1 hypothetical protein [Stenotrophomonas sp. Sm6012]
MRILEHHTDPVSGHTYAVIVNPVADTALPTLRYRLIRAISPNWVQEVNTTRSVSRTSGIAIYEEFDCLEEWKDHPRYVRRVDEFKQKAYCLATALIPRSQK